MLDLPPPGPAATGTDPTCHRARWMVVDPETILENGFVRVESGRIKDVGSGQPCGHRKVVDHGDAILMPALVNTHTHLELSALKEKMTPGQGFRQWVREVLELRQSLGMEALITGVDQGIGELFAAGCGAAGEISTLGITGKSFVASGLGGVWFREFLGAELDDDPQRYHGENGQRQISLAGHAPHTTAPNVLRKLKAHASGNGLPFSIHLAESEDELEFIRTAGGAWADFLTERGIRFSDWRLPSRSPVQHLENLGVLDRNTLAVHVIHADAEDIRILGRRKVHVCLCPRSNLSLHGRLPDVEKLADAGISLCLGTDSLASVPTLSVFDEMACLVECCPSLSPAQILAMATVNGAEALEIDETHGTLSPGRSARFLKLTLDAGHKKNILERLVHHGSTGIVNPIAPSDSHTFGSTEVN